MLYSTTKYHNVEYSDWAAMSTVKADQGFASAAVLLTTDTCDSN